MAIHSLTRDELLALLGRARAYNEQHWLLLLVTFAHGLRATEAVNLRKSNFRDGYLVLQRLKGSNKTVQPLVSHANELLDEDTALTLYIATLRSNDKLFDITRHGFLWLMKKLGAQAGIPAHKCHPHVLKHTTAMLSIKSAGIENVRVYLGHRSIASTGEYLKVSQADASRAFAAAVEA